MTDPQTVQDDVVVSLEYTVRLNDGSIVDSSVGREPLQFLQGHGQVIEGLEQEIHGMRVGETKEFVVTAARAYGERIPEAMEWVPRAAFPAGMDLEPGMGFRLQTASGESIVAYVREVLPDRVLMDFNHPLAGEDLHFEVTITGLRAATSEELAHGHVH